MASITVLVVIASVLVQTFAFRLTPRLDGRIVGGEDADIEDFPYQLSFQYFNGHICGASIISDAVALTAAHCTDGMSPSYVSVRAGSTYHATGGQEIDVSSIFQHPSYNTFNTDYDVSTLWLVSNFVKVDKVALQPMGVDVPAGTLAIVTGWGATSSGGGSPDSLLKVEVARVSDTNCRSSYGSSLTDRMICFASPGKDSCQGDSGGPLVSNNKQVGIVSWGYGCADPKYPGIYTKISHSSIHNHITDFMYRK